MREGDGGGAVGDDDRGATAHHLAEGVTDLVLLGGVDRGGGVVEDQHPGIGQDGAGDRYALALASREREAPLPDRGVVALGQRLYELRSEEHTSELQSLMRISYAVFCLKKKKVQKQDCT